MISGERITGKRVDRPDDSIFEPGEYGKGSDGVFYGTVPGTDLTCNLARHTIVEHEDGTITVTPSILVSQGKKAEWHGYITAGVWISC